MSENLKPVENAPEPQAPEEQLTPAEAPKNINEVSPVKSNEAIPAVEEIRNKVENAEQDSTQGDAIKRSMESIEDHAKPAEPASGELKQLMFDRTIKKVQGQLSTSQRTLSKLVHQPTVDKLSEVGAKTVARPSGLLIGGIFAFLGSAFYLYITKHNHYQYNYLLFVIFFVGGFVVGLIVELLLFLLRGRKAQKTQ